MLPIDQKYVSKMEREARSIPGFDLMQIGKDYIFQHVTMTIDAIKPTLKPSIRY